MKINFNAACSKLEAPNIKKVCEGFSRRLDAWVAGKGVWMELILLLNILVPNIVYFVKITFALIS